VDKKPLIGVSILIVVLLIISPVTSVGVCKQSPKQFSSIENQLTFSDSTRDETELKYYNEQNLSTLIGTQGESRIWQSAIRLTQKEMAPYTDWTLTKVNIAFNADHGCPSMTVRIYIYDEGTDVHPGPLLVNDTAYTYHSTGVTTIPLLTPVNLTTHQELWIAVEWNEIEHNPGVYYAWLDTLTGSHVPQKGDWYNMGSNWYEIYIGGADFDGNWGIGGIVEGRGIAELSIGNIRGPIGIQANLSSIGEYNAENVSWSIAINGGLFHRINATATGTLISLVAGSSIAISIGVFFGFGKILIVIAARAENTLEVTFIKNAFLLGPFVVGIR